MTNNKQQTSSALSIPSDEAVRAADDYAGEGLPEVAAGALPEAMPRATKR